MKNRIFTFFLALSTICSIGQETQDLPHSTIYLVRGRDFFGANCRGNVVFHNQRGFNLGLNTVVKYKVYSEGDISITLDVLCPPGQYPSAMSASKQVVLNVVRGNEYYVFYNAGSFKEVEKSEVQKIIDKEKNIIKQEENIDNPISKSSIKDIAKKEGKGQGTCFLISDGGYFITNFHCIENAKEITVRGIDGDFTTKYGATVVASDRSNDLALIKIGNKNVKFAAPPFSIRSSSGVEQAEKVYALGFPKTEVMGTEIKITEGIISAKSGVQGDISKFQISAVVNSGNSGGPLVDEDGNVIGVIYAKSTVADAAGYAIKSNYLEVFLKNVENFDFPVLTNMIKDKTLPQKVQVLKDYIFILETN